MHDESEHDGGEFFGGPSDADQAIIKAVPIVLDSASYEPSTGRAAVIGEEHAGHDDGQPQGDPAIQAGLQLRDGVVHEAGEGDFGLRRPFATGVLALESLVLIMLRLLLFLVLRLRTLRFGFTLGHPWLSWWSVRCEKPTTSWRATFSPRPISTAC